jgi:hypothetical protein
MPNINAAESDSQGTQMGGSSVDAMRELCDDLDSLVQIAKQNRAPIRALSFIERARADLQAYLNEIDPSSAAGTHR